MTERDLKLMGGMFHCLSKWDRGDVQPTVAILDTCKGGAHGGGWNRAFLLCAHNMRKLLFA